MSISFVEYILPLEYTAQRIDFACMGFGCYWGAGVEIRCNGI
jgi:hypothetical protein